MNVINLLFSFRGRIGRQQYWLGCLAVGVLSFVVMNMSWASLGASSGIGKPGAPNLGLSLALLPLSLVLGWSSLAIQFKRFHDRGRSGFWSFLPLLPLIMMIDAIAQAITHSWSLIQIAQAIQPWLIALLVINVGFFIDLGCLPGTTEPNKYDNPPPGGGARPTPVVPGLSPKPVAAAGLNAAELAMERAIAQRTQPQAQTRATAMPAPSQAQPALQPRPAGATSFGKRAR